MRSTLRLRKHMQCIHLATAEVNLSSWWFWSNVECRCGHARLSTIEERRIIRWWRLKVAFGLFLVH